MQKPTTYIDLPCDHYPANIIHDGLMYNLTLPDWPEIGVIKEAAYETLLASAEQALWIAHTRRDERGHLSPWASSASSLKGEVAFIKLGPVGPVFVEED